MTVTETSNFEWFLVYTKPRQEKRAKENLENQGFESFLPKIGLPEINQPGTNTLELMFPRYVFTKIKKDEHNWPSIQNTYGVSHLVKFDLKPAIIPVDVVQFLKSSCDEMGVYYQTSRITDYVKGDKVIIKQGLLKGREGIFLSHNGYERVKLLLELTKQQVATELSASDLPEKIIIDPFKL